MSPPDQELVARSCHGDRDAFGQIVERYQTLVCSIAYSLTGRLTASEELAQETFVAAWQSIGQLRDPERLRVWLCGIVRNLGRNAARRRQRDVLEAAGELQEASLVTESTSDPAQASMTSEELALVDRTLATIPATYREPLVLYYRQEQSVARVAELLGLTEDAVKQRLARGRSLLRREIAATVEQGLRRSAPGRAFTLGVITALPVMSGTAKAASITVTGAKGVSAMNAAGWTGTLGAILGPVAGLAGAWFGVKMSLKAARSERERALIIHSTWWLIGLVALFTIGLTGLIFAGRQLVQQRPGMFAAAVIALAVGYTLTLWISIVLINRRQAQIRREEQTLDASPDDVAAKMPRFLQRWQYPAIYESPARLLGLPLISIRLNGVVGDARERRAAVGWIAIGDKAYGILLACGPIAVGGIATGAIACGVVSFAGLAAGLLPIGGAAVGGMAIGGIAVGILAFGGCAVAWKAAMGGLAASHELAMGGMAVGPHANDEAARQFVGSQPFFHLANLLTTHSWLWLVLVLLSFLPLIWARRKTQHP